MSPRRFLKAWPGPLIQPRQPTRAWETGSGPPREPCQFKRPTLKRHPALVSACFFIILSSACVLLWSGCAPHFQPRAEKPAAVETGKRLAFLGFKAALTTGQPPKVTRNPVSGSLYNAEPVSAEAIRALDGMLMERLAATGDEIIPPEEGRGALSSATAGDSGAKLSAAEIYREAGKAMDADEVLVGHVYRWQEREGTDFAVDRPASAAFDLNLIRVSDGALIWHDRFDRTQKSLSENLFDFVGFFKRGGRWLTVESFAAHGLDSLLETYPGL